MRKKKIIKIVFTLLLIALVGACLAIIVPPILNGYNNNGNNNGNNNTEKKDFDLNRAEELLDNFGFNIRFGCSTIAQESYNDTFKALVALGKVDSSKFKEEECSNYFTKENFSAMGVNESYYKGETGWCLNNTTKTISYNEVNKIYKELYAQDMPKKSINAVSINSQYYEFYDYIADKDVFAQLSCLGCGGSCYSHHIRKVKDATLEGNTLTIHFYDYESGYYELTNNHFNLVTSKTNSIIECDSEDSCFKIVEENYLDKLDMFEAVFEKNGENYVFKRFDKKLS